MTARVAHLDIGITVRRMDFRFKDIPRYWAGNDPYFTHLLNALSATFPEGERFFVHSVRQMQDQITDPLLKRQVSAFIGQEAMHAREHSHYNDYAIQHGIDLGFIETFIQKRLTFIKGKFPAERQLAITCALEHFTAILAEQMLTEPDIYNSFDESMQKLWLWHAVEESEHKAVAFDVYQALVGDYRIRIRAMAITTFFFMMHTTWFQARLLKADGKLFDIPMWLKGLDRMWGRKGHFRKLIPSYLKYYRRDFHPWQHDNRAVLEQWKKTLKLDEAPVHQKPELAAVSAAPAMEANTAEMSTPAKATRTRKPAAVKAVTPAKTAAPAKAKATPNVKPEAPSSPKTSSKPKATAAKPAKPKAAPPPAVKPRSLDKPASKAESSQKPAKKPVRKPNPAS